MSQRNYDDLMKPNYYEDRNGVREYHQLPFEFDSERVERLATVVDVDAPENAAFVREYVQARRDGLLGDMHVVEYVFERLMDLEPVF